MTFDEYQAEAALTAHDGADCIYYAGKLVIEAAEAAQPIFKMMYHGKPATSEQMMDELGDVLWYAAGLAGSLGLSLSAIAAANIAKLRERHGTAYRAAFYVGDGGAVGERVD